MVRLGPGRFSVTITAQGFTTVRREGVILQVAEKLNLPIRMEVGQITAQVTVIGEQELIQTATASRGQRNQHQYGGIIGGPIRRDKDFVFLSFEGWQERVPFPSVTTVPPMEIRGGNFNFTPTGQPGPIPVYDQLTSVPCTQPGASTTPRPPTTRRRRTPSGGPAICRSGRPGARVRF